MRRPFQSLILAGVLFIPSYGSSCSSAAETNTPTATPPEQNTQNAEDQFRLGRAYYRGEGVPQSFAQAGIWYRRAADQGNTKAMYNLGVMFLKGEGTPKDEMEGYHWIRKSAEAADPRAGYLCGVLLCKGTGVTKNEAEGEQWLKKAADHGEINALTRLGKDYLDGGDGLSKDPAKALPFIQSAADKGNPWACGALGEILEKGVLLPRDLKKSQILFQQGAALGDPSAQFNYARILMATDPAKAYPWITLAIEGHDIRAIGLMNDCRPSLSAAQLANGDAEADKIRSGYQSTLGAN